MAARSVRAMSLFRSLFSECDFPLHQGDCAGQRQYDPLGWQQYTGGLPGPGGGWERTIRTSLQGAAPR
jgi:hypothetical protein